MCYSPGVAVGVLALPPLGPGSGPWPRATRVSICSWSRESSNPIHEEGAGGGGSVGRRQRGTECVVRRGGWIWPKQLKSIRNSMGSPNAPKHSRCRKTVARLLLPPRRGIRPVIPHFWISPRNQPQFWQFSPFSTSPQIYFPATREKLDTCA